jgi:hypothetical protein
VHTAASATQTAISSHWQRNASLLTENMAARLAALAVSTLLPPARQFCSSAGHSVAAHLPLERLQHAITPHVGAALMAQGYAVVDGVLGRQTADALRSELLAVRDAGLMHLNKTHLVTPDGTRYLAKAQVAGSLSLGVWEGGWTHTTGGRGGACARGACSCCVRANAPSCIAAHEP